MRSLFTLTLAGFVCISAAPIRPVPSHRALPVVVANPNIQRGGVLRRGVLTVALEVKPSLWHIDGPDRPPMTIAAFAEVGKPPLLPGPLVRVPEGTEIRFSVRNTLSRTLKFVVPAAVRGGPPGLDSVLIAPGTVGQFVTRASVPGNYLYAGAGPNDALRLPQITGLLAGALVVDAVHSVAPPPDRVFVMMVTPDSVLNAFAQDHPVNFDDPPVGRRIFTINGRSWPNTERVAATAGDTLRWRIINATNVAHPMHLHGFYYRVDALWSPSALPADEDAGGRMVVTQLLNPFSTMSMTWSPSRPGNWIFHCHFAIHLMPDSISASADDPHMRGMVGLILGINVAERPGARSAGAPIARRQLRLDAVSDSSSPDDQSKPAPTTHFVLEENGQRVAAGPAFSPEIGLTRGEPVSIMVVNHLAEPTSVHWHGIELEDSYVDGVPGVSGAGQRLAPMIAPGDSFEARFTPPRSGTFMYHAHVDEVRQQEAGLEGALIVRDSGVARSTDDQVFFIKGSRFGGPKHRGRPEVNGQMNPDTVVLHVGRPARLRILSLATNNPVPIVSLTTRPDSAPALVRDTLLAQWRPVAKDGADLPAGEQRTRPAQFVISIGETYDFEFVPQRRGDLRFELRANFNGTLLARVPIRVE